MYSSPAATGFAQAPTPLKSGTKMCTCHNASAHHAGSPLGALPSRTPPPQRAPCAAWPPARPSPPPQRPAPVCLPRAALQRRTLQDLLARSAAPQQAPSRSRPWLRPGHAPARPPPRDPRRARRQPALAREQTLRTLHARLRSARASTARSARWQPRRHCSQPRGRAGHQRRPAGRRRAARAARPPHAGARSRPQAPPPAWRRPITGFDYGASCICALRTSCWGALEPSRQQMQSSRQAGTPGATLQAGASPYWSAPKWAAAQGAAFKATTRKRQQARAHSSKEALAGPCQSLFRRAGLPSHTWPAPAARPQARRPPRPARAGALRAPRRRRPPRRASPPAAPLRRAPARAAPPPPAHAAGAPAGYRVRGGGRRVHQRGISCLLGSAKQSRAGDAGASDQLAKERHVSSPMWQRKRRRACSAAAAAACARSARTCACV